MLYLFQVLRYTTAKKLDAFGSYYSIIYIHGKQENEVVWVVAVQDRKSMIVLGKNMVKKRGKRGRKEYRKEEKRKRIIKIYIIIVIEMIWFIKRELCIFYILNKRYTL